MSAVTPSVFYRDPAAALRWLEAAFGFETSLLVTDESGALAHAEMAWRDGRIGVGGEFAMPELLGPVRMVSPLALANAASQFISLEIESGLDAHCERARAAGARITQAPADQFYGARTYRALDPEGHVWTFRQAIDSVSPETLARGRGLTIQTPLDREPAS